MDSRNLRAEMARNGISWMQVGKVIGLDASSLDSRFQGRTDFKVNEIVKIRDTFFLNCSLEYLTGFTDYTDERGR